MFHTLYITYLIVAKSKYLQLLKTQPCNMTYSRVVDTWVRYDLRQYLWNINVSFNFWQVSLHSIKLLRILLSFKIIKSTLKCIPFMRHLWQFSFWRSIYSPVWNTFLFISIFLLAFKFNLLICFILHFSNNTWIIHDINFTFWINISWQFMKFDNLCNWKQLYSENLKFPNYIYFC